MNNKQQGRKCQSFGRRNLYRLMALIALSPLLVFASCSDAAEERAEKVGGVTARQVIENPAAYVGKTVTVSGDIEEIWGPRAFNMDSGLTVGELLVVGREPFPNVPDRGNTAFVVSDVATVTGVVRMLVIADVEREIGWDLDPNIEAEFNAKPVLIAQSISFKAGAARAPVSTANNAPANNMNTNQAAAGAELTDVLVIVAAPDRPSLVGRRVRFTDVKVQDVVGDTTFYVGPSATQRILVDLDEQPAPNSDVEGGVDVNPGQTISFTGVVTAMPAAAEAKTRFGRLLNESEFNNFLKQQIYIRTDKVNIAQK